MIFWVALALRLACIVIGHTYRIRVPWDHFGFGWEMGRIARSLALGQGYANPFNGPSGPTAWTPPLYPLLMAASFKMFGIYTNAAAFFLLACNSVFSAAIAPAVYEIAARCFDANGIARRGSKYAEPVALWSAWLWAAYPAALQYAIHWIWEMSLSTCLFTWSLVLALRLRRGRGRVGHRARGSLRDPDWPGRSSWALRAAVGAGGVVECVAAAVPAGDDGVGAVAAAAQSAHAVAAGCGSRAGLRDLCRGDGPVGGP